MTKDNKLILKEFLRLKWHETKWILLGLFAEATLHTYISIPFLLWMDKALVEGTWIAFFLAFVIDAIIILIGMVLFIIFLAFVNWIKYNWKQATKNVSKKRRK